MRFTKKKRRTCDTVRYVLEKVSRTKQKRIILQTVTTSLVMRTNVLIKPLLRNHLHQVQIKIKISRLEHN